MASSPARAANVRLLAPGTRDRPHKFVMRLLLWAVLVSPAASFALVAREAVAAQKAASRKRSNVFASLAGLPEADSSQGSLGTSLALNPYQVEIASPQLTPLQFLFVSSPSDSKIVYTQLKNFKSLDGRSYALIDSGLEQPCGLAFDGKRGSLYVADRGANRIYRYTVYVEDLGIKDRDGVPQYKLQTDGTQVTIVDSAAVEWVSVDHGGDVFYSDTKSQTINRIPLAVIDMLASGAIGASDLNIASQKTLEAKADELREQSLAEQNAGKHLPTDAPTPEAQILSVYEGDVNPYVSKPAGVVSDGVRLYWVNGEGIITAVQGEAQPQLQELNGSAAKHFPAVPIANTSETAFGIAKSNTMVFFTANTSRRGTVYGLKESSPVVCTFVTDLVSPRGLIWDGDQTVFVADEGGNTVWSFPAGRLMNGAPLTRSVEMEGAFGVALLTGRDPAFTNNRAAASSHSRLLVLTVAMLVALASSLTGLP